MNGVAVGTATISARLVSVDSGAQSALLTVNSGGGGPGQIFLGLPNEGFTQVGNPNWGCGTFSQNNAVGLYSATINYGEGGGVENLPFLLNPPPGSPCVGRARPIRARSSSITPTRRRGRSTLR